MRTLNDILKVEGDGRTSVEKAIQAAYWAGQSDMRGKITKDVAARFQARTAGRYHGVEARALAFVVGACLMINGNVLAARPGADAGDGEAAEIMAWDFEI